MEGVINNSKQRQSLNAAMDNQGKAVKQMLSPQTVTQTVTSSSSTTPDSDQEILYCEEPCKFERKDKKANKKLDMIQCSVCRLWYHNECMGLRNNAKPVIWPCPHCCSIFELLATMNKNIEANNKLIETVSATNDTLKASLDRANTVIDDKKNEYDLLKETVVQLQGRIKKLESDLDKKTTEIHRNGQSLLIGDSLIRDVDEGKLVRTKIKAIPGANIKDITKHLSEEAGGYDIPLNKMFVCVGTNNCSSDLDLDTTSKSYQEMIDTMKTMVRSPADIVISSIPPRCDGNEQQSRVESLNAVLTTIADDTGAVYVENDASFKLTDGSINDGYILPSDGIHLTKQGTNRLLKNMQVPIKHDIKKDATKSWRQQNKNNQRNAKAAKKQQPSHGHHPHIEDETDGTDLSHSFWSTVRSKARPNRNRPKPPRKNHRNDARCGYCCEFNHTTAECGFKQPVECRQCHQQGHKQKFCSEMSKH